MVDQAQLLLVLVALLEAINPAQGRLPPSLQQLLPFRLSLLPLWTQAGGQKCLKWECQRMPCGRKCWERD